MIYHSAKTFLFCSSRLLITLHTKRQYAALCFVVMLLLTLSTGSRTFFCKKCQRTSCQSGSKYSPLLFGLVQELSDEPKAYPGNTIDLSKDRKLHHGRI